MMTAADLSNRANNLLTLLDKMEEGVRIFRMDEERKKRDKVAVDAEAMVHHNLVTQFNGRVTPTVLAEAKARASRLIAQGYSITDTIDRITSWILCAIKPASNDIA